MNRYTRALIAATGAVLIATSLTACGDDDDQRVAYFGDVAYCPYEEDLSPAVCNGTVDNNGDLIPPERWIPYDDDDFERADTSNLLLIAMLAHVGSHHSYYHSKKYKRHVPADRWAAYNAGAKTQKARYGTFKSTHKTTISRFDTTPAKVKTSSGGSGFKSGGSSTRSSGFRSSGRR